MRFEYPHLLWLLPVLPGLLLFFLWWSNRVRQRLLNQFVQARLLPELTVGISTKRQRLRALLLAISAGLIVIALAKPQWGFTWEEAKQKGLDIVVAIDTSKSMLADDIKPDRLARAKLAALDLMQMAKADRLGVIAFAGGAFLQCPLTLDDGAFRQCIDELNVNIIPQGGTALAQAIRTATDAFKSDDNFKVLVLFTDGEDHDAGALDAATAAAQSGMRIFTIGLGTEQGEILRIRDDQGRTDYVRDSEGQVVKSRLNEAILQEIAGAAQGFYLPLRGADTMETLYEKGLAPLPKSESEARLYQHYHEQFHWPLGLAVLLLLLESILPERRREFDHSKARGAAPLAACVLLLLLITAPEASASAGSAARDYKAGNYTKSLEEYEKLAKKKGEDHRLQYNAGAAAYRAGKYPDAIQRFGQATGAPDLHLQEQAYYNRGNSLYRSGEQQTETADKKKLWEQAIKDFGAALKLDPQSDDAQFNLEFVKKKLQELEQQQQQQENQENQQDDQNPDDQKKDQQKDQQNSQDQQQNEQSQQSDNQNQQQNDNNQQQKDQQSGDEQQDQQQQSQENKDQEENQQSDQDKQQNESQPENPSDSQSQQQQQSEEGKQGQPTQPSNLTPEQAAQLLDNLKGEEQMLPIRLMTPQPKQPPAKDW